MISLRAGDVNVESLQLPMSFSYNAGMYVDATTCGMKRYEGIVAAQSNTEEGRKNAESTGHTYVALR